jgi:chromosome segregation ATPase
MEQIDWLSREMILSYIAIVGAVYKGSKEIYARLMAEARERILAEQSVSTTQAKNEELKQAHEARERAERQAENLREDLDTCQAEKGRLWSRIERLESASS